MGKTELLTVKISKDVLFEIKERVRLRLYPNESEVVGKALKKAFAQEARDYLRNLVKAQDITEKEMLNEWRKIRD